MLGLDFTPSKSLPPAFGQHSTAKRLTNRHLSPRRTSRRQYQPRRRPIGNPLAQTLFFGLRQQAKRRRSRVSSSRLPPIVLLGAQRLPRLNQRHHWTKEPPDETSAASVRRIAHLEDSTLLSQVCHQGRFSASPTHIVGSCNITPMLFSRLVQPWIVAVLLRVLVASWAITSALWPSSILEALSLRGGPVCLTMHFSSTQTLFVPV